ncbi:hypothetical protein GGG16DRAFT_63874 [Schizophyllum commune]
MNPPAVNRGHVPPAVNRGHVPPSLTTSRSGTGLSATSSATRNPSTVHLPSGPPSRPLTPASSVYSDYSYYPYDGRASEPGTPGWGGMGGERQPGSAGLHKPSESQATLRQHRPSESQATVRSQGTVRGGLSPTPSSGPPKTPHDFLAAGIAAHEANKLQESARLFETSATLQGGCGVGMLMWGLALRHGWGVPRDEKGGFRWLRKAAEMAVRDLEGELGGEAAAIVREVPLADATLSSNAHSEKSHTRSTTPTEHSRHSLFKRPKSPFSPSENEKSPSNSKEKSPTNSPSKKRGLFRSRSRGPPPGSLASSQGNGATIAAAEKASAHAARASVGMDRIASGVQAELVLAIYEVGQCFFHGWGVPKDMKMGVQYYTVAARLGDADAQADLGFCLANGKGCKKDRRAAARWYRAAVSQGASDIGLAWIYKDKFQ